MIGILLKPEISDSNTVAGHSDARIIIPIIVLTFLLALGGGVYNYRVKKLQESLEAANSEKSDMCS